MSGVLGGFAEYLGIDSTVVRLVIALSMFYYGAGLWIYLIAAIIMPEGPVEKTSEKIVERVVYVEVQKPDHTPPPPPVHPSEEYNI